MAAAVSVAMLTGASLAGAAGTGAAKKSAYTGTLTVWDWQYTSAGWGKAMKQLDAEFMKKNPGLKIKHVGQPFNNYNPLIQAALSSKTGPDVVMFLPAGTGILNWTKALSPLTKMITPAMKKQLSGWDVVSKNYNTADGIYGVPTGIQADVFYYNKQLFTKAGLDPNSPPTTYAELVADAKKLKAAGITPFGGGNKEGYENDWWFTALWGGVASKQDSYDLASGKIKWTDPKVAQVTNDYVNLFKAGYFSDSYTSTPLFPDGVNDFAAGKSAMFLGLASSDASYKQFNATLGAKNVGVFEAPGVNAAKPAFLPAAAQVSWSITSYSKQQAAAFAYIQFMTGQHGADVQFRVGGVLPNNNQVKVGSNAAPQVQQMIKDYRTQPTVYPPHGLWKLNVSVDHQRQLNLVLAGSESVDDALKAIQSTQDRPS